MSGRSIPSWAFNAAVPVALLAGYLAVKLASGPLELVVLVLVPIVVCVGVVGGLRATKSGASEGSTAEPRGPREVLDALDAIIASAKPTRFGNNVVVDSEQLSALVWEMRMLFARALGDLRWYEQRRQDDGGPPLGNSAERITEGLLDPSTNLDNLLQAAPAVAFRSGKVVVGKERLAETVEPLRDWLAAAGKELAAYRSLYPGQRERAVQVAFEQRTELEKVLDEADDLLTNAAPVPLTDQVRIDPSAVRGLTSRMRAALPRREEVENRAEFQRLLDRLDALVGDAKAIPLTDQVRVDREALSDILDELLDAS